MEIKDAIMQALMKACQEVLDDVSKSPAGKDKVLAIDGASIEARFEIYEPKTGKSVVTHQPVGLIRIINPMGEKPEFRTPGLK